MGNTSPRTKKRREQAVNIHELFAKVAGENPEAVERAIRGVIALLGLFDGVHRGEDENGEPTTVERLIGRVASLSEAMVLPAGLAGDMNLFAALTGMSEDGIRDLMDRKQAPYDTTGRDRDSKRARRIWNAGDVFEPRRCNGKEKAAEGEDES